ncbi:hypothetical protein B0H66DRAFT_531625 [Apodospora peruviana]|uniref:Uncharacterized protein n=1 Tax=Apodospora peruviana TaxID=516989 RepID=A0AAE0M8W6_9PEZI|nr:hypothetical protein B0H66DRAFT_531625 [Apodospora peruviana]
MLSCVLCLLPIRAPWVTVTALRNSHGSRADVAVSSLRVKVRHAVSHPPALQGRHVFQGDHSVIDRPVKGTYSNVPIDLGEEATKPFPSGHEERGLGLRAVKLDFPPHPLPPSAHYPSDPNNAVCHQVTFVDQSEDQRLDRNARQERRPLKACMDFVGPSHALSVERRNAKSRSLAAFTKDEGSVLARRDLSLTLNASFSSVNPSVMRVRHDLSKNKYLPTSPRTMWLRRDEARLGGSKAGQPQEIHHCLVAASSVGVIWNFSLLLTAWLASSTGIEASKRTRVETTVDSVCLMRPFRSSPRWLHVYLAYLVRMQQEAT